MRDFDAIKKKEMSSIENRIRHIYNVGYEDCLKDQQQVKDEEFKQGVEDAWECMKKICRIIPVDDFAKVFGDERVKNLCDIIMYISPAEAIEKVKEYEKKTFDVPDNCKIEVGDEVYVPDLNEYAIVIEIVSDDDGDFVRIIRSNGKPQLWVKDTVNLTGNHCDSIVDLLKRLEKRNA